MWTGPVPGTMVGMPCLSLLALPITWSTGTGPQQASLWGSTGLWVFTRQGRPWSLQRAQEAWPRSCGGPNSHQDVTRQLGIPGSTPNWTTGSAGGASHVAVGAPQEASSPWTPKVPRRDQPVRFSSKKLVSCDTSERKRQFRRRMFSLANTRVKIPPRIPAANELIADERRYSRCPSGRQHHPPAALLPQGQRTGHSVGMASGTNPPHSPISPTPRVRDSTLTARPF